VFGRALLPEVLVGLEAKAVVFGRAVLSLRVRAVGVRAALSLRVHAVGVRAVGLRIVRIDGACVSDVGISKLRVVAQVDVTSLRSVRGLTDGVVVSLAFDVAVGLADGVVVGLADGVVVSLSADVAMGLGVSVTVGLAIRVGVRNVGVRNITLSVGRGGNLSSSTFLAQRTGEGRSRDRGGKDQGDDGRSAHLDWELVRWWCREEIVSRWS